MNEYYADAGLYTVGFNQMQTDTYFSNFLADNWVMIRSSVHFLSVDLLSISVVRNACSRNAIFF